MTPLMLECIELAGIPATTMLLGSLAVFVWSPGRTLLACLQCFGAGIILGAIGSELLPRLKEIHEGVDGTMAITGGFFAGFTLMFYIKSLSAGDEDDSDSDKETAPLVRRASMSTSRVARAAHEFEEHRPTAKALPWGLITAVALDSFVDGFFLGMSLDAAPRAGMILAVATAIEMCFLGLTFSASMLPCGLSLRTVGIVLAMPAILMLGGITGSILGAFASTSPQCYAAFLSFGVAALIFLVTQELLLEANERQPDENLPYINSCLFIGFWAILVIERVMG